MTQAFPLQGNDEYEGQDGMTLRDYFAAQALQALIIREGKDALYINEITTTAYQYADDMLQEREA
jgi:hypothetical protein